MGEGESGPGMWDRLAPVYDLQARLEQPSLRVALELAAVSGSDRVLDAGCGTGQWLRLCLERHRPRRLVGVDRSGAMLVRARRTGAEVVRSDLCRLPFADASFDVACIAYVLHLLEAEEVGEVLAELRRVLSPSGRLVTVTPRPHDGPFGRLQRLAARHLAGTSLHALGGLRPLDPRDALRSAGFEIDRAVQVQRGYDSLCVRGTPGS